MTAPDARALLDELEKLRGEAPPSAAVPDPADVEKAARAMWLAEYPRTRAPWEGLPPATANHFRRLAAAALAAVRPSPDSEAVARVEALADERVIAVCDTWEKAARDEDYAVLNLIDDIRAALGTGGREGR